MHICIIFSTPFPPREGIGNYVYGLSTILIEKCHKVTVIARGSSKMKNDFVDNFRRLMHFWRINI
jgi:glycosyltransferase involved in cell wall biosynthesis